jgi:hypothetical protein
MTDKEKSLSQELSIGSTINAQLMRAYQLALGRIDTLENEAEHLRRTVVEEFTVAILHGPLEHQEWLREAAEAFICRQAIPKRRG